MGKLGRFRGFIRNWDEWGFYLRFIMPDILMDGEFYTHRIGK